MKPKEIIPICSDLAHWADHLGYEVVMPFPLRYSGLYTKEEALGGLVWLAVFGYIKLKKGAENRA